MVLDRRVESVHGQKGIVRCERIIAVEVIRTAVECIGTGFHHHVYHRAWIAPKICATRRLLVELIDGFDGQQHARDAGNAPLVDGLGIVPEIIVIYTVDLPVVLVTPVAVHGAGLVETGCELQ